MKKASLILFILILFANSLLAQDTSSNDTVVKKYIVAIKQTPPFIIKNENEFSGASIDLWQRIANDLNVIFEFKEYQQSEFSEMLNDIETGKVDICINPLTVSSDRLNRFEYTLPFYSSHLAIIVPNEEKTDVSSLISNFFTKKFFKAISALLLIISVIGFFIWLVEKKKNNKHFRKGVKGWGDGFWWAAVTMTTVGYGEKIPKSSVGKIFTIIWMFTSIIIISSLTGSIAASLTVNEMQSHINNLQDVKNLDRVGTMKGTNSEVFLTNNNFNNVTNDYESILDGLYAVKNGNINAFIYDEAIVKYLMSSNNLNSHLKILPYKINVIYYSFAVPKDSKILNDLNTSLVEELESVIWIGILNKYNLNE